MALANAVRDVGGFGSALCEWQGGRRVTAAVSAFLALTIIATDLVAGLPNLGSDFGISGDAPLGNVEPVHQTLSLRSPGPPDIVEAGKTSLDEIELADNESVERYEWLTTTVEIVYDEDENITWFLADTSTRLDANAVPIRAYWTAVAGDPEFEVEEPTPGVTRRVAEFDNDEVEGEWIEERGRARIYLAVK